MQTLNLFIFLILIASSNYYIVHAGTIINNCGKRWGTRDCIYFGIEEEANYKKNDIFAAINTLMSQTNAKFIFAKPTENVISLKPSKENNMTNPSVVFIDGNACASSIGKQTKGQYIYISPGCGQMAILHETVHTLGVYHEQCREDRDNYVSILWDNINPTYTYNFKTRPESKPHGPYDYASLMHYGAYFYTANGQKTIESNGNPIGLFQGLTQGDINAINEVLKECSDSNENEKNNSNKNNEKSNNKNNEKDQLCIPCNPICIDGTCNSQTGICNCTKTPQTYYYGDSCESSKQCQITCLNQGYCNADLQCTCFQNTTIHYHGSICNEYTRCDCASERTQFCSYGKCICKNNFTGDRCDQYNPDSPVVFIIKIFIGFIFVPCCIVGVFIYDVYVFNKIKENKILNK